MTVYVTPTALEYANTPTATQWNTLVNDLIAHETRILALEEGGSPETPTNLPIGACVLWYGAIDSIPAHFALCDGTGITPDMRDLYPIGAGSTYAVGDTAGAATHTHTVGSTGSGGSHTHTVSGNTGGPSATANSNTGTTAAGALHTHAFSFTTGASGTHTHTNPDTGAASSLPSSLAWAFIMRID